ncbi:hypothetical protein Pan181_44170 [Aeoliella mucimassa]|uniref:Uncharacterized protein n=1 Tax=Aeoliella mucimassa TaxID=2527972 RepID=A0A518ATX5_9BACT|nr:hypothetical protein Pan181_44170 [Aeoliella mucimassa]
MSQSKSQREAMAGELWRALGHPPPPPGAKGPLPAPPPAVGSASNRGTFIYSKVRG